MYAWIATFVVSKRRHYFELHYYWHRSLALWLLEVLEPVLEFGIVLFETPCCRSIAFTHLLLAAVIPWSRSTAGASSLLYQVGREVYFRFTATIFLLYYVVITLDVDFTALINVVHRLSFPSYSTSTPASITIIVKRVPLHLTRNHSTKLEKILFHPRQDPTCFKHLNVCFQLQARDLI